MALTAPNGPGEYSVNLPQNATPTGYDSFTVAQNLTPTSQYGPALAIAGSQVESLNFHPTSEHNMQPGLQNRTNLRYQSKVQTQCRPNYHPSIQNQAKNHYQPMAQNYPMIQNVSLLVGTSPAANNTPIRAQHQRQMFGDPHSTATASRLNVSQAMQSARTSGMAQPTHPAQPAQPAQTEQTKQTAQQAQQAAHEKKVVEAIETLKGLKKKRKIDFGDHIHSSSDAALFSEAEQRMNMKLTPELAKDFPKDSAQQGVLARDLANVLESWKTRVQPGASKGAIKRIKSKEEILILLNAWKIMVINSRSLMWLDSS